MPFTATSNHAELLWGARVVPLYVPAYIPRSGPFEGDAFSGADAAGLAALPQARSSTRDMLHKAIGDGAAVAVLDHLFELLKADGTRPAKRAIAVEQQDLAALEQAWIPAGWTAIQTIDKQGQTVDVHDADDKLTHQVSYTPIEMKIHIDDVDAFDIGHLKYVPTKYWGTLTIVTGLTTNLRPPPVSPHDAERKLLAAIGNEQSDRLTLTRDEFRALRDLDNAMAPVLGPKPKFPAPRALVDEWYSDATALALTRQPDFLEALHALATAPETASRAMHTGLTWPVAGQHLVDAGIVPAQQTARFRNLAPDVPPRSL